MTVLSAFSTARGTQSGIVRRMIEKELPGGQQVGARVFDVAGKVAALEKVVKAVDGQAVPVLAVIHRGPIFGGFEAEHVVVTVALAEGAVVEEIVADPDVDHGRLRRDGFDGGVGIDARHHGEKAVVTGADNADAAVVAGHVFEEPGDGVVCVGAFVDGGGIAVIGERAHHDEFALALVAAANVFADEDVTVAGQLGATHEEGLAVLIFDAVGRALDENGQRRGNVGGFEDAPREA